MILLLDTNVLLDVLGCRLPFYAASARIWVMAEKGQADVFISAISFNNIYYIVRKASGKEQADDALRILRDLFNVVAPDRVIINQAIDSNFNDFEDALQYYSAKRINADYIITRNAGDFPVETLSVLSPSEFLAIRDLESETGEREEG